MNSVFTVLFKVSPKVSAEITKRKTITGTWKPSSFRKQGRFNRPTTGSCFALVSGFINNLSSYMHARMWEERRKKKKKKLCPEPLYFSDVIFDSSLCRNSPSSPPLYLWEFIGLASFVTKYPTWLNSRDEYVCDNQPFFVSSSYSFFLSFESTINTRGGFARILSISFVRYLLSVFFLTWSFFLS